ncbi:MAG: N-acetylneuraminate synthase family protein [Bacteroidota bacterium]
MIKIGNIEIRKNGPPFIIAEVGINHNGCLEKAFEMIKVAKDSGVDAVKFQTFKAVEFVGDATQMFTYKSQGKTVTESMLEMFKRYEFEEEDWIRIKQKCDEEKIMFFSTPQNKSDLALLQRIGVSAIKVGSDDFTNLPLLEEYSKTQLPIILSCGMADLSEVYQALEMVGKFNGYPVALLLCTSEYPTPPNNVNLLKLKTLRGAFEDLILGFSDHTQGALASSLAVAMGAVIFEKHFTLDNYLPGPDHWFSENPSSLKTWAEAIRSSHTMMGNAIIKPTAAEANMRVLARRSVVALKNITIGEILNETNIGLRRPGNGIQPKMFGEVLRKKSRVDIKEGSLIKWTEIE